ncbi:MAG TPA: serine hydrolase domain-containing protein [Candidatus Limnocylindria bacterium]|nr:serine hydrolase domain-containing protein [Candidatus Limnocylindria bacterium]
MTRPIRLAAGWSIALLAAILLNLAVPRTTSAPEVLSTQRPVGQAPATQPSPGPDGQLPPVDPEPGTGFAPGAGSLRPVELQPFDAYEASELQAATARARAAFGLDALAIGVSIRGQVGWTGASGMARDGVTPLDGHSPFAIASITKTFTASLVLQLVEDGRLALTDKVAPLLPHLNVPEDVTVGQLLHHTAGMTDLLNPLRDRLNADLERIWRPAEVVRNVGGPAFPAGRAYAYSNTNYVLLGMLVERVGGQPYVRQLRHRLLDPLEMNESGMLLGRGAPPLMVPSWASAFGTAGAMYSTPHDLLRWADALYGGRVLHPRSLHRMLTFKRHGYGLGVERVTVDRYEGYGHSGLLRGFTSLMVHLPEQDVTLVVMGTTALFDPARVLSDRQGGAPSILDLALRAAALTSAEEPAA